MGIEKSGLLRSGEGSRTETLEKRRRRERAEAKEREVMRIRRELMEAIREYIGENGLTQKQAAERFAVSQPRISEIVQGKTQLFTVDKLIELLGRVGRSVEVRVRGGKKGKSCGRS